MKQKNKGLQLVKDFPQLFILLGFIVVFSFLLPETFLSRMNLINIMKNSTTLLILACGMTCVVITGNLDLSMGASLTLSLAIAMHMQGRGHILLAFITPFIVAPLIGWVLGVLVGKFEAHAVIATLGMMTMLSGFTYVYTKGSIARGVKGTVYSFINDTVILSIPLYVWLAVAFAVFCAFLLNKTNYGRSLYYMGVNMDAAKVAGINTSRVMLEAYLLSAFSVALATTIIGSRMLVSTPSTGTGYEFDALTAILVGGVALSGGKGKILNTVLGVYIVTVVINGLTQLNMPYEYQNVVKGVMVMISILTEAKVGKNYE